LNVINKTKPADINATLKIENHTANTLCKGTYIREMKISLSENYLNQSD